MLSKKIFHLFKSLKDELEKENKDYLLVIHQDIGIELKDRIPVKIQIESAGAGKACFAKEMCFLLYVLREIARKRKMPMEDLMTGLVLYDLTYPEGTTIDHKNSKKIPDESKKS